MASTSNSNVVLIPGDLFAAPANSLLIHACNCIGSWRSGVAAAFKTHYPAAHSVYAAHCAAAKNHPESLAGTALLIPPQDADKKKGPHWIACLFTSVRYGKGVDGPNKILQNTEKSLADLQSQVNVLGDYGPGEWHAAKINSVRFKVPWSQTESLINGVGKTVVVYEYDEGKAGKK